MQNSADGEINLYYYGGNRLSSRIKTLKSGKQLTTTIALQFPKCWLLSQYFTTLSALKNKPRSFHAEIHTGHVDISSLGGDVPFPN